MSSSLRLTACLRAWASRRLVFNSSTGTRRPRSAIRSMMSLLANPNLPWDGARSASGPALPHSELEHCEIGGPQQAARRQHDAGWTDDLPFRDRRKLCPIFDLRGVDSAKRAHQRLHRLDRQRVIVLGELPLDFAGEPDRLIRQLVLRHEL